MKKKRKAEKIRAIERAKHCVVCGRFLLKTGKICCSPRCAGKIYGNRVRGTGVKSPYIKIRINGKQTLHHRYVWEKAHGRKLRAGEIVHHKNENKRDNRPQNLEVLPNQAAHLRLHNYNRPKPDPRQRHFNEIGWEKDSAETAQI